MPIVKSLKKVHPIRHGMGDTRTESRDPGTNMSKSSMENSRVGRAVYSKCGCLRVRELRLDRPKVGIWASFASMQRATSQPDASNVGG